MAEKRRLLYGNMKYFYLISKAYDLTRFVIVGDFTLLLRFAQESAHCLLPTADSRICRKDPS